MLSEYWENVLQEVIHKEDNEFNFHYTDVRKLEEGERQVHKERRRVERKNLRQGGKVPRYKKLFLGGEFPTVYLTRREVDCVAELIAGKNLQEVADALGLSYRTVEFYMTNIRAKVNAKGKKELVEILSNQTDFINQYERV